MPAALLDTSQWAPATEPDFSAAWLAELDTIPATTSEMIHLVSGLILPLWTTLPFHTVRVYRLQTDDGTRLIGRVVDQQWLDRFTQTPADTPNIHHAWPRLLAGDITRHLADNIALRRVNTS